MEVVDQFMVGVLFPHPVCYGIGIVLVAVPCCVGKVAVPQRGKLRRRLGSLGVCDQGPVPLCFILSSGAWDRGHERLARSSSVEIVYPFPTRLALFVLFPRKGGISRFFLLIGSWVGPLGFR